MQLLLTRQQLQEIKQVSNTFNEAKLNEQIREAQMFDLRPLLGERLFNKVVAAPEDYTDLLNGCSYTHNNLDYTNYGLKMVLSYYAYARYAYFGAQVDTPTGIVEKLRDNATIIDVSIRKTLFTADREKAFSIWENVRLYLLRTDNADFKATFTNYCHNKKPGSFKISKIG